MMDGRTDSPVDIQHGRTRPSDRLLDPGYRRRTRTLCRSTCLHGNGPHPGTGSFLWREHIRRSTDWRASLWSDPAQKRKHNPLQEKENSEKCFFFLLVLRKDESLKGFLVASSQKNTAGPIRLFFQLNVRELKRPDLDEYFYFLF